MHLDHHYELGQLAEFASPDNRKVMHVNAVILMRGMTAVSLLQVTTSQSISTEGVVICHKIWGVVVTLRCITQQFSSLYCQGRVKDCTK